MNNDRKPSCQYCLADSRGFNDVWYEDNVISQGVIPISIPDVTSKESLAEAAGLMYLYLKKNNLI